MKSIFVEDAMLASQRAMNREKTIFGKEFISD